MTFLLTCYIALIILMLIVPLILFLDKFSNQKGTIRTFFLKIKLRRIKKLKLTISQLENKFYELQSRNVELSTNNALLKEELSKLNVEKQDYKNKYDEYKKFAYERFSKLHLESEELKAETEKLKRDNSNKNDEYKVLYEAAYKSYTSIYKEKNQLKTEIEELKKEKEELEEKLKQNNLINNSIDYRTKHKKPFRCKDGDYVRSKSEREIDDFLFDNKIWHIYEKEYTHPKTGKKAEPDFYLNDYNLYIEYFGMSDPDYIKRRDEKIKMYQSDKSINFEYLTYKDDYCIYEKLINICQKYSILAK